jgi:hypothetical protein
LRGEIDGGVRESMVVVTMRGRWTIKRKEKEKKKTERREKEEVEEEEESALRLLRGFLTP